MNKKSEIETLKRRIIELETELACERAKYTKSRIDISGQRFGRLMVTKEGKNRIYLGGRKNWLWKCKCDCGGETFVTSTTLRNGSSQSCGCLQLYVQALLHTTHGKSETTTYRAWGAMIARCAYPKNIHYKNYGGRGIKVCEKWRKSFEEFLADMGMKPKASFELDRINNDGDYEPGNCRWVSKRRNCNNRSTTIFLTKKGRTFPLQDWARLTGLPPNTIKSRIRLGWSVDHALTP